MPLLMGLSVVGTNLVRSIQVNQFCRDIAHMYAYGIDFSQPGNQTLVAKLSQGLNVRSSGGDGVVLLSTITYVAATDCTGAGLLANTTSCPNLNQAVVVRRIVVGNSSLLTSHYATPKSSIVDSEGKITAANYLKDTTVRAKGFTDIMALTSGQYAYLTETYVAAPDLEWKNNMTSTGTYAYNIF